MFSSPTTFEKKIAKKKNNPQSRHFILFQAFPFYLLLAITNILQDIPRDLVRC